MQFMSIDFESSLNHAKKLPLDSEKIDYLVAIGEYFIHRRKYGEARKVAEYILQKLDSECFQAKKFLMLTQIHQAKYAQ